MAEAAKENAPERVVGDFVLLEPLAESRTGKIYKAKHRVIGRLAALKLFSAQAAAMPQLLERFQRKIKILARLNHPNLVAVQTAGEHEGTRYLAMEYVDGRDLGTTVKKQGPLAVEEAVGYLVQAAAGLGHAHAQGVYHRNVKPSNLMVDRQGLVKVVGFGLAHVEAGAPVDETQANVELTRQGQILGSQEYIAPEQIADAAHADQRADIYSLGCTLHTLLTGRPPYPGKSAMAQFMAHRGSPIPALRPVRPEVPEPLDAAFQKMLAKKPEDRYQSMEEVAAALRGALTAASGDVGGPPATEHAGAPSATKDKPRSSAAATTVVDRPGLAAAPPPPAAGETPTPRAAEAAATPAGAGPASAPIGETTADHLRAVIGLPGATGTAPSAAPSGPAPAAAAAKPQTRRKSTPRTVPIVVGGVLAVLVFILLVQYFHNKKTPEVAKPTPSAKGDQQPGASKTKDTQPAGTSPAGSKDLPDAVAPHLSPAATPPLVNPAAAAKQASPEPKEPKPPEAKPSEPQTPDTKPPETKPPETKPAEPEKPAAVATPVPAPLPDEAARQRAAKLVQDTFQDELAAATTGAQKVALAQEMLRKSKATGDDPAGRYALLAAGYALAKEANDPVTALQAIDRMAHYFAVDAWSKKTQLLSEMADAAKMLTHHRVIAEQALVVTQKATEACRFEVAARLSELAVGQAGKAQEPRLLTRARAIAKECNRALTQFRQYEAAKAKLEQPGGDPQASLAAGRYECLILGDWDAGLRKLAAGSDESLRSLAAKDLATPEDADARAAVGDGWWELAKDESDAARATLYRRAAWWYEKALPQATGVLKIKLQKRLDTIKAAAAKPASP